MRMRVDKARHYQKPFCVQPFGGAFVAAGACAFDLAALNLNIAPLDMVELSAQQQAGVGYGYGHLISYIVWIFPSLRRSLIVSSAFVAASAARLPVLPLPMPQLSLMSIPAVT